MSTHWFLQRRNPLATRGSWHNTHRLSIELLESRLAPTAGLTLTGPLPPNWNQLYDLSNNPSLSTTGYVVGQYAAPGTNPFVNVNAGGNINLPFTINGSPSFNQPVQTSDWWSNLMLRIDPTTRTNTSGTFSYNYANALLNAEPVLLRFQNSRFTDDTSAWIQGLGIANPNSLGIDPTPTGANENTQRNVGYLPLNVPLTIGIGGNTATNSDAPAQEITPLGTAGNRPPSATDEGKLNVRVNQYSDWGVELTYGDGNPDAPINTATGQPTGRTNALTMDLLNGSPFLYFNKWSAGASTNAFAKVWLRGSGVPGTEPAGALNVVWGRDLPGQSATPSNLKLPNNVLAVTLTTNDVDASGVLRTNTSSYLVVAPASTNWSLSTQANPSGNYDPQNPQIWTNPMSSGAITVVLLPHSVGNTKFEALSAIDQVNVAKLFLQVAGNVPNPSPSVPTTVVSDPTRNFSAATGRLTTTYTVNIANNNPTYQVLYPHHYNNLVPANQNSFLKFTPTSGVDVGQAVELSFNTLLGKGRIYSGNSFSTQLQFQGLLDHLPNLAAQTDATAARVLYEAAESFMQRYIADPNYAVGVTDNTYNTGLMLIGQTLQAVDALASPRSLLTPQQRETATLWRDRLLQGLKTELATWFDVSTGRFFQLNTTYDTVIGYPAGFGSDFGVNDHHFHYGYFLASFATVGQFDPAFVQAYLPQIQLLMREVANFDRSAQDLPFLREFNPWAGHAWADGLGTGGNNEESASESVNFSAAVIRLGLILNNPNWVAQGVYLYQTEIESMNQYWFNTAADPANGNFGNYPAEYARYVSNGRVNTVTQIANVNQLALKRGLFFDSPNYAEAVYAINWLPTASWMLFLGANQDYIQRNWTQFVTDSNIDGRLGVNQAVVAGYQALLPDQGFGLNQPGATNALLRLDADQNPAFVATSQTDPGFKGGYLGTNRFVALNWVYALQKLGQVDFSVLADTPSYGVFVKDGQRTYVATNYTAAPITVTFRDRVSGIVLQTLLVQPGQMATLLPDGTLEIDASAIGQVSTGTSLFLSKPANQDPNAPAGLTLSRTAGTTNPTAITPANATQKQIVASYSGTFTQVPKRPGDATNIGNQAPDASGIIAFSLSGLNGAYNGGYTGLQLFLNNALTWNDDPNPNAATKPFGDQYGPGVLINDALGRPEAVIEVRYSFNGDANQDRVETYSARLSGINQYNLYDNLTPNSGVLDPNVPRDRAVNLLDDLSQLRPFQNMANGTVTVRMWQGTWSTSDLSHKEFSVSVNADPDLARSSRIVIPFTDNAVGPSVLQIDPPAQAQVRASQPVTSVRVHLSQPAAPGTFTTSSLTLTDDGVAKTLSSAVVSITQDPSDPTAYIISGLGQYQTTPGQYVLTVNGAQIRAATGPVGSGPESVNWVVDTTAPTLQLSSTSPTTTSASPISVTALFSEAVVGFAISDIVVNNATVSNFRGFGRLYSFDVTPSGPGVQLSVSVPAAAVTDAAGNPNSAASFARTSAITGPTAVIRSTANATTNLTSIPVTVTFSSAVSGLTASEFIVRNATISGFPTGSTGTTYAFNLVPTGAGVVSIDLPAGVAQDTQNRPNAAAATLRRTFDPTAPTGVMTSIANYLTYDQTIPVVLVLSESVTGFTASDLVVSNGSVANFQGSGSRYTFDLVANDLGVVSATIAAGAFQDTAGNSNAALPALSRNYRITPTSSVTTPLQTPTNATSIPIQIAFNQAMTFANFASAVQLVNATLGSVTSIGGAVYTFNIIPTNSNTALKTFPVSVILQANTAKDAYGNGNPEARLDLVYGATPKVTSLTATTPGAGQFYYNVAIQFDQNVVGLDATKLTASNATITDVSGGGALWNFILTPKPTRADYNTTMTIQVEIADGAIVSEAGVPYVNDAGSPIPSFTTFTITGPTLVLSSPVLGKTFEGPITVTAKFSEPVTGFTLANLGAGSATIPSLQADPTDASLYTFTLVPNPGHQGNVNAVPFVGNVKTLDNAFTAMNSPSAFNRLIASPVVTGLTSTLADGTYGVGQIIPIQVTYSAPVQVSGQPILTLNAGSRDSNGLDRHDAQAIFSALSADGRTLTFLYTVEPGQASVRLDADSNSSISLPVGAMIKDGNGVVLPGDQLNVPAHGAAGSLGANKNLVIDTLATTTVVSVTSSLADGVYAAGQLIPIQVKFSRPVVVTGGPDLLLALGSDTEVAVYGSGSGTDTLTFNYLVGGNQRSHHLDYVSSSAIDLDGGSIVDAGSNPILLTLPEPGSAGSLSFNKAIAVSSIAPRVLALNSTSPSNTTFGPSQSVSILVNFDTAVNVTGTPHLLLNSGGTATYTSGSGTNQLLFTYTVAAGQQAASLDAASANALTLNGGTITDQAGNVASLLVPVPRTAGSLSNPSDNRNLKIAGIAPTIVSVFADVNGPRQNGSGFQIYVKFSDTIELGSGTGTPTLALNNGDFATFSGIVSDGKGNGNTLIFVYIPGNFLHNTTISGNQLASASTINVASTNGFAPSGFIQTQGPSGLVVWKYTGLTATSFTGLTLITGQASDTISSGSSLSNFVNDIALLDVDTTNPTPINLAGRTLKDAGGNTANLTLPAVGQAGSLGVNNRITIKTQFATAPLVTNVSSPFFQGTYGVGSIIPITVTFTQPVIVTGTPQITLNSGGTAFYTGGSGTRMLRFSYLVQAGENTTRLDFSSIAALAAPGGTIRNSFSNTDANLALPAPGAVGSLGYSTRFIIDTSTQTTPSVIAVNSPNVAGVYRVGQRIRITVVFDRSVIVTPSASGAVPFLQLNSGTSVRAVYTSGSGTNTLTFTYTVAVGQSAAALELSSTTALQLNGARIRDRVNSKDANLTLPIPGLAQSLRGNDLFFIALSVATPTTTSAFRLR